MPQLACLVLLLHNLDACFSQSVPSSSSRSACASPPASPCLAQPSTLAAPAYGFLTRGHLDCAHWAQSSPANHPPQSPSALAFLGLCVSSDFQANLALDGCTLPAFSPPSPRGGAVNHTVQGAVDSVLNFLFSAAAKCTNRTSCTARCVLDEVAIFVGCRIVESPSSPLGQIYAATVLLLAWCAVVLAPLLTVGCTVLFALRFHFAFILASHMLLPRPARGLHARHIRISDVAWRALHFYKFRWIAICFFSAPLSACCFAITSSWYATPDLHRLVRYAHFTTFVIPTLIFRWTTLILSTLATRPDVHGLLQSIANHYRAAHGVSTTGSVEGRHDGCALLSCGPTGFVQAVIAHSATAGKPTACDESSSEFSLAADVSVGFDVHTEIFEF